MRKSPRPWKEYGRYGSVGIELVLSIVLGYWAGHWLDGKVGGGHGWLTIAGSLLGVYAGFRALFAAAAYMERDIARAERRERGEDPWPRPPEAPEPPSPGRDPAPNSKNEKHNDDR
jgi:F0F1-type ATP synthase assembly protein I